MMPGTKSAFSGCGVCTGAAACCPGVGVTEAGLAAVCCMLGAIACGAGCADFLVSLLSHATSNINPAARKTIFERFTKRFTQHSISRQACPHHTFCWTGLAVDRQLSTWSYRTLVLTEPVLPG